MKKETLVELKEAIELDFKISEEIADRKADFEELNKEVFDKKDKVRAKIAELKVEIWEEEEKGFYSDGIKQRLGGIGIRVGKVLEYDEMTALKWAKEHDLALTLDKKRFEQLAKTEEIVFVDVKDKITVTFPKNIDI